MLISNSHLCFVSFPAKAKGPSDESDKEGQVRERDILLPPLSINRLRTKVSDFAKFACKGN